MKNSAIRLLYMKKIAIMSLVIVLIASLIGFAASYKSCVDKFNDTYDAEKVWDAENFEDMKELWNEGIASPVGVQFYYNNLTVINSYQMVRGEDFDWKLNDSGVFKISAKCAGITALISLLPAVLVSAFIQSLIIKKRRRDSELEQMKRKLLDLEYSLKNHRD